MKRRTLLICGALLLGACERSPEAAPENVASAPAATADPESPERLASDRIYYELTRFGWYARGEPLLHEQQPYQPAGAPLAAPLDEMQRAGEYQGVEYYRRAGDERSLYVPVFDGYWLLFRPGEELARADAD